MTTARSPAVYDLNELPVPQRLALAHCSTDLKPAAFAAFMLDARLGQFVSHATEPLVAQLRLSWWREQLAKSPDERPRGDAILDRISDHCTAFDAQLAALVDGWEHLLAEPLLTATQVGHLVRSRSGVFAALSSLVGEPQATGEAHRAGRLWALADLAAGLSDPQERALVVGLASDDIGGGLRLPFRLRHLAILGELGRSALHRGGASLIARRRDYLLITRLGLFGR